MSFLGKVVLVTGAAGGLGKAIANAFLQAGASVTICDVMADVLQNTVKEFNSAGFGDDRLLSTETDVTNEAAIDQAFTRTIQKFGRLDVLVNNAGITDKWQPVGSLERSLWDRVIAINLTAPYLFSKRAVNQFLAQEPSGGAIINIASMAAIKGCLAGAAYVSSKSGLVGLTKNTAAAYNKKNIRAVVFLPGGMNTRLINQANNGVDEEGFALTMKAGAVEPKISDVNDVAKSVLFYAGEHAYISNGAVITVDGGWSAF
ncbi:Short chain dehydrogenase [Lasiodiplodia theobromae]|uniref:Short chain dehydrogenase n=1 Tax=Lasiodiplodia theobromae TaxID=45133 RepID=UPI0015C2D75B|nr:Short chain dehydrogenase [Lasiodiplodia theobromae]KAF4536483.1 Short chain dehydrogenase [Lasiodiplodia theobromae]